MNRKYIFEGFFGFYGGLIEDSCHSAFGSRRFVYMILKDKTSGHPATQRHIAEDPNPESHVYNFAAQKAQCECKCAVQLVMCSCSG